MKNQVTRKGGNHLIQKGNFLLLEKSEFREWLKKQTVTRPIEYLQVHHTYLPNYSTRRNQDPFKCLEGMRNSHLASGWAATGQNISVLEDGRIAISLDRNLNRIPAGIKGFNSKCICVEIVADFNIGGDKITQLQKESVVHLYACLAEKFNVPINTKHIVYHAWVSTTGQRLPDFIPGKSSKSCPGSAFFGDGNTITAANKNFIPQIKAEYQRLNNPVVKDDEEPMTKEEKLAFEKLQEAVTLIEKRLNIHADQTYVSNYEKAVVAAKNSGTITSSNEKSKLELNMIQMMYNNGLLNKELITFFKGFNKETREAIEKLAFK